MATNVENPTAFALQNVLDIEIDLSEIVNLTPIAYIILVVIVL